jgi:hypothetical protein
MVPRGRIRPRDTGGQSVILCYFLKTSLYSTNFILVKCIRVLFTSFKAYRILFKIYMAENFDTVG